MSTHNDDTGNGNLAAAGSVAKASTQSLPQPQRERWQPLRSGLINLYKYDREEFHYENGRLLLRGNNGTGKSRVLALQLPFLLDGETVPQRLEPDADPAKRVEWNLLMGRYPDRTGYTWIEFGRRDEQGQEHYITLGCGLSAVDGQIGVRKWFFISSRRMGIDLEVTGEGQQVLGKDRLRERIGESGQVYEDAGIYRRAVNDALFHLDDYRYASFVNLLIQLRRPQLTRQFNDNELAGALSEALPPVSPAIIARVAEAFRTLEADRNKLESFKTAMHAVDRFMSGYQAYAKVAAKRRVDRVRAAHCEYEAGMNEILISEADCDRSLAELAKLRTEIQQFSANQDALQAEIAALQQSPEATNPQAIEQAERDVKDKRREAEAATLELADAVRARTMYSEELAGAKAILEQRQARLTSKIEAATRSALSAGLEDLHRECFGTLDLVHSRNELEMPKVRQKIEAEIQTQLGKIEHIRKLNERLASLGSELQLRSSGRDQLAGLLDDARERLSLAQQQHNSATASLLENTAAWSANLKEVRLSFEEPLITAVTEWCENPQGPNPLETTLEQALSEVTRDLAEQRAHLRLLESTGSSVLARLQDERNRLGSNAGHDETSSIRTDQPGSPLWLLCDFFEGLDEATQGAVEAALEASGLLNARITPSGELVDPETNETILIATCGPLPSEDAHLGTVLKPCTSPSENTSQVPPYVVADILRQIGAKPNNGHTWVSTEGRWQNGVLQGRASRQASRRIGEGARETARRIRILELDAAIAEAQTQLDALTRAVEELDRRQSAARNEVSLLPDDERVRVACVEVVAGARHADSLLNRLSEMDGQLAKRQAEFDEAVENRNRALMELGVATWMEELNSVENGVNNYRFSLSSFWPALEATTDAQASCQKAATRLEDVAAREVRQKEIAGRLERAATSAEIVYNTLKGSVGADSRENLRLLEQARQRLGDLRTQERVTRHQHHDRELALARVDERLRNLTEMLNWQTDRRNAAAASLKAFACTGLLHLAAPPTSDDNAPEWSTTRSVEKAFELAARLDSIEAGDSAWEQYQKLVPSQFNELMQALSAQGCQPSATFRDDVFVARAVFAGRECAMEELRQNLSEEVTARQMLLDAREREIMENHLVGEVSSHLYELLHRAEEQVDQMNVELESRPTSTGMKLRFVWRPVEDGPLGLADVRKRLMQSSDTWSPAERKMLGGFLQHQIQTLGSQIEGVSWQEALAEALDYRKWHRFDIERCQDGTWKRLTRRSHGTGSGGEKAVALTLPHFAAAAAFYRTADPLAPRLILLDEAFVGIDGDMRAKCMGLIHTFDLDFMMTSEREWGCYRTLPGLAIYQLSTRPDIDAINLTRWVWNGQQRTLKTAVGNAEQVTA